MDIVLHTLVVDDDEHVLDLMAWLLRRAGHQVTTAADGLEAHSLVLNYDFDLCVLDHDLPGMTGGEIADALRAADGVAAILLVSGASRIRPDKLKSIDGVLRKPFTPDEFLTMVHTLVSV